MQVQNDAAPRNTPRGVLALAKINFAARFRETEVEPGRFVMARQLTPGMVAVMATVSGRVYHANEQVRDGAEDANLCESVPMSLAEVVEAINHNYVVAVEGEMKKARESLRQAQLFALEKAREVRAAKAEAAKRPPANAAPALVRTLGPAAPGAPVAPAASGLARMTVTEAYQALHRGIITREELRGKLGLPA